MVVLLAGALSVGARSATSASSAPGATAAPPLGIVLLHGKKGSPVYLGQTKAALRDRGYLVTTPEMCWSERRAYDRDRADCLGEIDAAVAELRQQGAARIVIAGHSLGGAAAIAYGASHDGLAGVIGFAAGDAFWGPPAMLPDIARAQRLVADGKGDAVDEFADIRIVGNAGMRTTAAHFLSFVALPATDLMPANAARLRVPLLLVAGTGDRVTLQYDTRTYDAVAPHPLNRFVSVDADHNGVLYAGKTAVLDWLAGLPRGP